MPYEYFIGGRYIKTRQKHVFISFITVLSIAGVTVGVTALIVVIAVMAGFESDLTSRIIGVDAHILVTRPDGPIKDVKSVIGKIRSVADVVDIQPFVAMQVMLKSASGLTGAYLKGIPEADEAHLLERFGTTRGGPRYPSQDEPPGDGDTPGVVLGQELAKSISLLQGDNVYIVSPNGAMSPIGFIPVMKRFHVKSLLASGMYEYDGSRAYIHLQEAQKLLRMGSKVSGIEIRVKDLYRSKQTVDRLDRLLGPSFTVKDWTETHHNLFSALKLEKLVMFLILTLIVLVAAFNIASSLIMMVIKKRKDIGILKAMGATRQSIRRIFMYQGVIIGLVGTGLGACFGVGLCELLKQYHFIELPSDVYYITTLPVQLRWVDVVLTVASALAICLVATLYPANQASKIDPVEAIRYG